MKRESEGKREFGGASRSDRDPSGAAGPHHTRGVPPPGEESDHELIRRAQRGEEAAFAGLVRRHEERAWRVARNMVPGEEDARDLVQDAFLRVFRSLDRFDFQHEFSTWLFRIVTNLAIDQLRKRRPTVSTAAAGADEEPEGEMDIADAQASSPSERLEAQETAQRVRVCLASLAPHFQSVLLLREIEGMGCPEIADIVGATHVTVRWRLHRGRKLFQEEWERRERLAERGDPTAWKTPRPAPADDANNVPEPTVEELDEIGPTT